MVLLKSMGRSLLWIMWISLPFIFLALLPYFVKEYIAPLDWGPLKDLATIVAIGSLIVALFQLRQAVQDSAEQNTNLSRQVDIMEKQFLASRRPWVSVEVQLTGDWEYGPQGATIKVAYKMKNHGTTPAIGVYISPGIFLWRPGLDHEVIAEQNQLCEMGQRDPPVATIGGAMLFPGQESIEHSGFHLGKKGIEKSLEAFKDVAKDYTFIFPHIIGCVTYRSTFDGTIHKTPFIAQITRRGSAQSPDNSPELLAIDTKTPKIPANMLSLKQMIFPGGIQAD